MGMVAWLFGISAFAAAGGGAQQSRDAAALATTTRPAPVAESESLFLEGSRALAAGDAERGVELLSAAVMRRPESSEYVLRLSEAYVAAGRARAALDLLENYAGHYPGSMDVRVGLAALHVRFGRPSRAEELLAERECDLPPRGVLALAEARRGRSEAADAALERGLARYPRDESLWLARIDLAIGESRWAGALKLVREAEARCGETPEQCFRAARAYFELGELLGAAEKRAVPDGTPGRFHGNVLLVERTGESGEYLCAPRESALYQVRRALDGGRDAPETHLLHARVWRRIGRPRVAYELLRAHESELTVAGALAPEALELLAAAAMESGRPAESLRYSRRWAELEPARREAILRDAYLKQAESANERGEEGVYLDFLARAARTAPTDAGLQLRSADANWDAGRREGAREAYLAVLRLAPRHPRRASILERLAQIEGASDPRPTEGRASPGDPR